MFENIIGQDAVRLLADDISGGRLAPSMLFRGPEASGKGSAALELARVLSCEEGGAWNCACPHCAAHRLLGHQDLMMLGPRSFYAEIAAAQDVFVRNSGDYAARLLLIRAIRKLLQRFDPALWEDDPAAKKIAATVELLDSDLDQMLDYHSAVNDGAGALPGAEWIEKTAASIKENAFRLESEGISAQVPVWHIRRAAQWCRMAPFSARKLLLIENADRMRDEARNALLKILEEPPETAVIVLSSSKPAALLPTILSRLRPYYFVRRGRDEEREVLRRVFRAPVSGTVSGTVPGGMASSSGLVASYLDTFLPVDREKIDALSCFFAATLAQSAMKAARKSIAALEAVFERALPALREAGFEIPENPELSVSLLLKHGEYSFSSGGQKEKKANVFDTPLFFSRFLARLLDIAGGGRAEAAPGTEMAAREKLAEIWSSCAGDAARAAQANIQVSLILERFVSDFLRQGAVLYATI